MPGRFFHGKAAEKPQFDDARLDGIKLFQLCQSIVELGVDAKLKQGAGRLVEHHRLEGIGTFVRIPPAGVSAHQPAHEGSGESEELDAVAPVVLGIGSQLEEAFAIRTVGLIVQSDRAPTWDSARERNSSYDRAKQLVGN